MFASALWKQLHTRVVRYIAPYDAAVRQASLARATAWIEAAEAQHQQILVAFYHSQHTPTRLPSVRAYQKDVRRFVTDLENWTIRSLARFNVTAERRPGRVGVWVARPGREDKIAAIGVRIRHWVSLHGISINVEPDLSHYAGIVPCGINQHGVTSLVDLGLPVTMTDLDVALAETFDEVFETVRPSAAA